MIEIDPTRPHVEVPRLDAGDGPALPLSPDAALRLVSATLRAHEGKQFARRRRVWRMAAGVALFIGTSTAVSAAFLLRQRATPNITSLPAPTTAQPPAPSVTALPEAPPAAPSEEPAPEPIAQRVQRPSATADLLARANHLRSQAEWRKAAKIYQQAIRSAPRSGEAYTAMVAAGALHREKLKDAGGAARLFLRALAANPSGPLSEEARWGLAESYRQLGRHDAERKALRLFLQHHPGSVLAAQARERLQAQ